MRLKTSGDRKEIRQSYLPTLFEKLVKPIQERGTVSARSSPYSLARTLILYNSLSPLQEAIPEVIELMDDYYITKEDWDTLVELGVGEGYEMEPLLKSIAAPTKSAFTRKCAISHSLESSDLCPLLADSKLTSLSFALPPASPHFFSLPPYYTGTTRPSTPSPSTATPLASPRRSGEEVPLPTLRMPTRKMTTTTSPRMMGRMRTLMTLAKTSSSRTKSRNRRRRLLRARKSRRPRGRKPSRP